MDSLETLKIMLGIDVSDDSEDEVLSNYLSLAYQKILRAVYPFVEDTSNMSMPSRYDYLRVEVAMRMYNMRGVEGENSHSENGVSRSYENIDSFIAKNVIPFCGVPKKL